jgi:hypothetical protein
VVSGQTEHGFGIMESHMQPKDGINVNMIIGNDIVVSLVRPKLIRWVSLRKTVPGSRGKLVMDDQQLFPFAKGEMTDEEFIDMVLEEAYLRSVEKCKR